MAVPSLVDTLVRGGLVVEADAVRRADVAISAGRIHAVGPDLKVDGRQVIDAGGKYVFPGIIDAHVHPSPIEPIASLSEAAAHGGTTTIIPFVSAFASFGATGTLTDEVQRFIDEGQRTSLLDFAIHASIGQSDDAVALIPMLVKMGVGSFKMYMTYSRRGMMLTDDKMLQVMATAAEAGSLAMVHAENGYAIDYLVDRAIREGRKAPEDFPPTCPNAVEAEAIFRAVTLAELTGCPLYVVHVSAHESIPLLRQLRERKPDLYTETCPQYLMFTNAEMKTRGRLAKMGPPLRKREDNDAMWQGLAEGVLDVVGSDSVGATIASKVSGGSLSTTPDPDNIFEARFGVPGAEWMFQAVFDEAVNRGRLPLTRLARVFCQNPARIFGLYPRKGTLQPGSDADLVVFDPTVRHTIAAQRQHGHTDFTLYEGRECLGAPALVMQRGQIIVKDGQTVATAGQARYLQANP
ncbi:MAG: amidohydrolase family protein [Chloroflexi bacterium]|nr:amidohydrolase family protein [Chloroflexota bacterium]